MREVENYLSGDKIECLICGKCYRGLSSHIVLAHTEISVRKYKLTYGIPAIRGLVGQATKQLMRDNVCNDPDRIKIIIKAAERSRGRRRKSHHPVFVPATRSRQTAHLKRVIRKLSSTSAIVHCQFCKVTLERSLFRAKMAVKHTCSMCKKSRKLEYQRQYRKGKK